MWYFILDLDVISLYHTVPTFNNPQDKTFENIMEKGEYAGNQHLFLFPKCFLLYPKQILIFESCFICRLQILWI